MIALVLSLFAIGLLTIGVTAFRVARRRRKAHYARETAFAISPVIEDGEKVRQAPEISARDLFPEARK